MTDSDKINKVLSWINNCTSLDYTEIYKLCILSSLLIMRLHTLHLTILVEWSILFFFNRDSFICAVYSGCKPNLYLDAISSNFL